MSQTAQTKMPAATIPEVSRLRGNGPIVRLPQQQQPRGDAVIRSIMKKQQQEGSTGQ